MRHAMLIVCALALAACGDTGPSRPVQPLDMIMVPGHVTPSGNYRPTQYRLVQPAPVRVVRR